MKRACVGLAWLACLLWANLALGGAAAPTLVTASGTIVKVGDDSLTIKPRGPDGKFGKSVLLKLTGTSKITALGQEKRAGKLVFVQRKIEAKELSSNQHIAVIYTGTKGAVLLSAVVLPSK